MFVELLEYYDLGLLVESRLLQNNNISRLIPLKLGNLPKLLIVEINEREIDAILDNRRYFI